MQACSCIYCTKHGSTYTSHRNAKLAAVIHDEGLVSQCTFGTGTTKFYVCPRCDMVLFVTSMTEGNLYAVVNVNNFQGIDRACFSRAITNFDGETTESRLEYRQHNWIPTVAITS